MSDPQRAIIDYPNPNQAHEILDYIIKGVPLSDFLEKVVCNDLKEAVIAADCHNQIALAHIVKWFFNHAPINCWGSRGFYERWVYSKGLQGLGKEEG